MKLQETLHIYLGHETQNEMIEIVGCQIQKEVASRAAAAGVFAVLMDETTDVSHKEQVSIFVRYVVDNDESRDEPTVEEHLLALVTTAATTGEALAEVLTDCLQRHNLDIHNVVGQGYDGGSNMRGASKGVQARIKKVNPTALFTHCFAHNNNNNK